MQSACVVLALISSAITLDFTYAGFTEVTGVTASANGWDTRISGFGCAPNGCLPSNVLDNSIAPASRWSCSAASAGIDVCELTLEFDAPQDLLQMDMALYKGDERTRSVNVWVDGVLFSTIMSSGTTEDYETYTLVSNDATVVVLQAAGLDDNEWLSITEVKLYVDDGLGSEPSPAPTIDESGPVEVTGVTASANGWDTRISGSGCAPNGCLPSNVLDNSIAPASRWSCSAASAGIDVCELTLEFDAPQDLLQMDMALYKGDERTRSVNVWVDGVLFSTIMSGGTTTEYETYTLVAPEASIVVLQAAGLDDNEWLSITEVKFMMGDASPTPSSTTLPPLPVSPTTALPSPTPSTTVDDDSISLTPTASTSTTEIPPTLQYAGLPDIVFDAVLEDALYGLANGVARIDQVKGIVLEPEDEGIAVFTGTVGLFDDDQIALPESITLYYYVYSDLDESMTNFTRGVGEVDSTSGSFTAEVPVPEGKSGVALSFVVLDEADRTANKYPDTVIVRGVLNGCEDTSDTITLYEWDC